MTQIRGDYQQFDLDSNGQVAWCGDRMNAKLDALREVGLPGDFPAGKTVLDVGCDMGFWSFLASSSGAVRVLGLDRNRDGSRVPSGSKEWLELIGWNNMTAREYPLHDRVSFRQVNLGQQFHEFGEFQIVFCMSVYHHIFAQCGSHKSAFFWLARHVVPMGTLIWEGPTDPSDVVVQKNVPAHLHPGYTWEAIREAFEPYFELVVSGPAKHEKTRDVHILRRRADAPTGAHILAYELVDGAQGATKAFLRDAGRRSKEIEDALGVKVFPGSLNMLLPEPFSWDLDYYRVQILDSTDRKNANAPWAPRWCRFYPIAVDRVGGWAMRFEDEWYDKRFLEMIAPQKLRTLVAPRHLMVPPEKDLPEVEPGIYEINGMWFPRGSDQVRPALLEEVKILGEVLNCMPGRERRVALQAGGHAGIYPLQLLKLGFKFVVTFEPDAINYRCLQHNAAEFLADGRLHAIPRALSYGKGAMHLERSPANSGAHYLVAEGDPKTAPAEPNLVNVMSIDSLDLPALDFLCLDVEGHEHNVLAGANATIERCKPLLMFEDKGMQGTKRGELEAHMASNFGYTVLARTRNDVVMGPR